MEDTCANPQNNSKSKFYWFHPSFGHQQWKSHITLRYQPYQAKSRGTSKLGYVPSASLIPFTPNTPPTKSSWIQQTAHWQRHLFSDHLSMQKTVEQEHVGSWRKDHVEALQGIPVSFKRQSHPTSDQKPQQSNVNHNIIWLYLQILRVCDPLIGGLFAKTTFS